MLQSSPQMINKGGEGNAARDVIQLRSRRFEVLNTGDIPATLTKMAAGIQTQIGISYLWNSDTVLDKLKRVTIHYDNYNPTRAGSYIELPKWLSSTKACINIKKNEDNKCSKYCVQCSVFKTYGKDSPDIMRHYNELHGTIINWGCVKFPCGRTDIDRFEELHQGKPANVYTLFNETTITDRTTTVKHDKHHINLLMIEKEDDHNYFLIKDLSKLIGCQYNKHEEKKHICPHCLRGLQLIETSKNILQMVV